MDYLLLFTAFIVAIGWFVRIKMRPFYSLPPGAAAGAGIAFTFLFIFYHAANFNGLDYTNIEQLEILIAISRLAIGLILLNALFMHLYTLWVYVQIRRVKQENGID